MQYTAVPHKLLLAALMHYSTVSTLQASYDDQGCGQEEDGDTPSISNGFSIDHS